MTETLESLLNATDEEKERRGTRYTPQEIALQPTSWRKTLQIVEECQPDLECFLSEAGIMHQNDPASRPTVFLVGAGTSDYIGRALTYLLRRLWNCEVWAVASTDLLTNLQDFVHPERSYLWISFTRSGESSEGRAILEATIENYPNIRHLLVTCSESSLMVRLCAGSPDRAFALILDESVNDRGLAMTNSYTNMVIAGHCLAHIASLQAYEPTLCTLAQSGERFLGSIQQAAPMILQEDFARVCFVGTGVLRAVAQESALKVLELTAGKIQTMAESTLGLRHGPMSAIDEETLFVLFLSQNARRRNYEMDLLAEIKRKRLGKLRVVVCPDSTDRTDRLADAVFCMDTPNLCDEYRAPVDVMLAQYLGLFSSLKMGLKPDCPSPSGVISRVVGHVNIYR